MENALLITSLSIMIIVTFLVEVLITFMELNKIPQSSQKAVQSFALLTSVYSGIALEAFLKIKSSTAKIVVIMILIFLIHLPTMLKMKYEKIITEKKELQKASKDPEKEKSSKIISFIKELASHWKEKIHELKPVNFIFAIHTTALNITIIMIGTYVFKSNDIPLIIITFGCFLAVLFFTFLGAYIHKSDKSCDSIREQEQK